MRVALGIAKAAGRLALEQLKQRFRAELELIRLYRQAVDEARRGR